MDLAGGGGSLAGVGGWRWKEPAHIYQIVKVLCYQYEKAEAESAIRWIWWGVSGQAGVGGGRWKEPAHIYQIAKVLCYQYEKAEAESAIRWIWWGVSGQAGVGGGGGDGRNLHISTKLPRFFATNMRKLKLKVP